jgi:hypothetical protein
MSDTFFMDTYVGDGIRPIDANALLPTMFPSQQKKQVAEAPTLDVSLNVYASFEPFGDTGSIYHDRWTCTNCHRTCRSENWGTEPDYERCPHCGAIICGGEK